MSKADHALTTKRGKGNIARTVEPRVPFPLAPGDPYEGKPLYALQVQGPPAGLKRLFAKGDYAVFVKFEDLDRGAGEGDLVHVERRRGKRFQTVLRRVQVKRAKVVLSPPFVTARNEEVCIVGLCIGAYRPGSQRLA